MSAEATEGAWDELTLEPGGVPAGRALATGGGAAATGYLFLLPYFIPFLAFLVVPVFWSIWLSLQQGRAARLREVRRLPELAGDRAPTAELTDSIKNTAIYVVEAIFIVFVLALLLALLLNRYRKGSNIFKLALYVPLLAPAVLVGLDLAVRRELRLRPLQPDPDEPRHRADQHLRQRDARAAADRVRRGLARPRLLDALLPREPAERPGGAARRRAGGRRQGLPALPARDAPDAAPDAAVRGRDRDHRQLPGVRHRLRAHPGRARTSRPRRWSGSSGSGCSSSSRRARATRPPCSCSGSSSPDGDLVLAARIARRRRRGRRKPDGRDTGATRRRRATRRRTPTTRGARAGAIASRISKATPPTRCSSSSR